MMGRTYIGRDYTNNTSKHLVVDEYDVNVDLMNGYLYGEHRGVDMHRKIIEAYDSFDLTLDSDDESVL